MNIGTHGIGFDAAIALYDDGLMRGRRALGRGRRDGNQPERGGKPPAENVRPR
jgi:hypothetical protein